MSDTFRPFPPALADRLRKTLIDADYTVSGVRDRLGDMAARALAREQLTPALRATGGEERLGLLLRLWWLREPVAADAAAAILPVADLAEAGLVEAAGDRVRALVRLSPWEMDGGRPGFVVSDPTVRPGQGTPRPDHVVGAGGASATLSQLIVDGPFDRALDIGTGCGVQSLHLASRAADVTATDVNPRALRLAEISWALSEVPNVRSREGSMYEPVAGERFDLVVCNPPFVISPGSARYTYRESGFADDAVCAELVRQAPAHLTDGGWCQILANWLHVEGEDWRDRVGAWVTGTGCSGWVVQRDVQDPAEYVELWLRDSCETGTPEYYRRYDAWLDYFERAGVRAIGFGWICLRNDAAQDAAVRVEEFRHEIEQPVGRYLPDVVNGAMTAHRLTDAALLSAHVALAPGVVEERIAVPGAPDPERILLRQRGGLRRVAQVGTIEAALAGVCDGTMPVGPLLDAIAELIDRDPGEVRRRTPDVLRSLIAEGFFRVAR
ncbi:methyltransferase [Streptomonospora nanhaiensis]|uniref:Methylase of polypeptide subunit release factors n=1 Tax=Streptomonospora nanhaiensis TaxID=1323731 RepID=A0A853BP33_9ACTN|nr:methyltransferase [Streptomonospora nanhaiensis]MBV2363931.1 methyltransferase [Streptomonospora nanhaiensis]MBX9391494.1 methyltransferase [Streptomonospora nanhaiensis]NYI96760.1 methylase of polypeptide subunit release factors [Streptomonospora nanhaiensis]